MYLRCKTHWPEKRRVTFTLVKTMAFLAPSERRAKRLNLRFDAVKSPHSLSTIFEGNVDNELDHRLVHAEFVFRSRMMHHLLNTANNMDV